MLKFSLPHPALKKGKMRWANVAFLSLKTIEIQAVTSHFIHVLWINIVCRLLVYMSLNNKSFTHIGMIYV